MKFDFNTVAMHMEEKLGAKVKKKEKRKVYGPIVKLILKIKNSIQRIKSWGRSKSIMVGDQQCN